MYIYFCLLNQSVKSAALHLPEQKTSSLLRQFITEHTCIQLATNMQLESARVACSHHPACVPVCESQSCVWTLFSPRPSPLIHLPLSAPLTQPHLGYWVVQWSWFAQVNALCNLSLKKSREVAASLLGWFLNRLCFMLCITMEVEPRIAKQYKCYHCCSCKNDQGKGIEGGEKSVCIIFWLTRRSQFCGKNVFCLLPDTFWLWASKIFLVGSVKLTNSLSPPSIVKNALDVKAAKGLKQCWAKVKGVNNPAWTAQ